ncbi:MAG: hypothetical protein Q9209_007384 [Squamulea sp. 1 TL-2023]
MPAFTSFLVLVAIVVTIASSRAIDGQPRPYQRATTPHVLSLSRKDAAPSQRSRYAKSLQKGDPIATAVLNGLGEILYTTNLTFGTNTFEAIVDTGSSDTWAIQSGFQCVQGRRSNEIIVPEDQCGFGTPVTASSTFKQIAGQNFKVGYADGEQLSGIVGTETVTLAGIKVENQVIGLVNHAYWNGDNSSSGLIGLAFPNLTSAYRGNDPQFDTDSDAAPYSPLFTSMYTQGLVAPVFSIAINRRIDDGAGGFLALGGLPPVNHSHIFACAPLKTTTTSRPGNGVNGTTADAPQYKFYSITVDGVKTRNAIDTSTDDNRYLDNTPIDMHVDSGSTLIYLPEETADAINDLFVPPAVHNYSSGRYDVDCAAKAPDLGIKIAGQIFHINAKDLVVKPTSGGCFSGITATYSQQGVLGDVFLKNVVAVFDIGHLEMRFAAREFY